MTSNNLFIPLMAKSFLAKQGTTDDAQAVSYFHRWFNPEDCPCEEDNPFAGQIKKDNEDEE